ncbi:MAG: DUF4112 domain-containing protein [Caulobacter sp.]|jgi:hypothetical protein|nr:DUF4112 domain-containing protein [Caulobacter sp.]
MSREHAHSAYRSAETVKKLSDRVIGFGPFGIGMDGLLTWIPGAGIVYSFGAGAFLLWSAFRSGASLGTLVKMAGFLGVDMIVSDVPIVGDVADVLWQGHLMAATTLQKDIETRHGAPEGMDSVLHRPKRRRTGMSVLALLVVIAFGFAVWASDFNELLPHGLKYAFLNASLPMGGMGVDLQYLLYGTMVLLFVLSVLRRGLQRRGAPA